MIKCYVNQKNKLFENLNLSNLNLKVFVMQTILVTGGAGFVVSHNCLTLLENKFKVIVIDSFIFVEKNRFLFLVLLIISFRSAS